VRPHECRGRFIQSVSSTHFPLPHSTHCLQFPRHVLSSRKCLARIDAPPEARSCFPCSPVSYIACSLRTFVTCWVCTRVVAGALLRCKGVVLTSLSFLAVASLSFVHQCCVLYAFAAFGRLCTPRISSTVGCDPLGVRTIMASGCVCAIASVRTFTRVRVCILLVHSYACLLRVALFFGHGGGVFT